MLVKSDSFLNVQIFIPVLNFLVNLTIWKPWNVLKPVGVINSFFFQNLP